MNHRARRIPVLLLSRRGLVKSVRFQDHSYIGDYLNAARLFSDLGADELIVLDIDASPSGRTIDPEIVTRIADEISMPLSVGGGIGRIDSVTDLIAAGAEKVVLCTGAWRDPYLIKDAAERHGSSAVCVCIDAKIRPSGEQTVHVVGGFEDTDLTPVDFAKLAEEHGAGEIVLQSIDRDGLMSGYDIELVSKVSQAVSVPVVALGGAGSIADMAAVVDRGYASAAAAGSMFVYFGPHKGVLINYPPPEASVIC